MVDETGWYESVFNFAPVCLKSTMMKKNLEGVGLYAARGYEKEYRFPHYGAQISTVTQVAKGSILEIGKGSGLVSDHLRKYGFDVTTCDIDPSLNPDVVGDIRELEWEDSQFDTILASEILEHIPYEDACFVLEKLARVARGRIVVSLPYRGLYFGCVCRVRGKGFYQDKGIYKQLHLGIRLPFFWKQIDFSVNKRHYWEIGSKGYPMRKIKHMLSQNYIIEDSFYIPESSSHHIFVLRPKN